MVITWGHPTEVPPFHKNAAIVIAYCSVAHRPLAVIFRSFFLSQPYLFIFQHKMICYLLLPNNRGASPPCPQGWSMFANQKAGLETTDVKNPPPFLAKGCLLLQLSFYSPWPLFNLCSHLRSQHRFHRSGNKKALTRLVKWLDVIIITPYDLWKRIFWNAAPS